jgi:hypothetical protein
MKIPALLRDPNYVYRGNFAALRGTNANPTLLHESFWSKDSAIEWVRANIPENERSGVRIVQRGKKSDNFYNVPFDWTGEADFISYYNADRYTLDTGERKINISLLAKLNGADVLVVSGLISVRATLVERDTAGEPSWYVKQGSKYLGSFNRRNILRISMRYGMIETVSISL